MPSGVYQRKKLSERTPEVRAIILSSLAKGRQSAARRKAVASLRRNGEDPAFQQKMSKLMRDVMHTPAVRKRHLLGLDRARAKHGTNFKGGNGADPTSFIKRMAAIYEPQGFKRELAIATAQHKTEHRPPFSYKVDFGNPLSKVVIEFDGVSHLRQHKERDQRKTEVLESLGWKVVRIRHR